MTKGLLFGVVLTTLVSLPASAGVITWTDWSSATTGTHGSAVGALGGIGITYSGDVAFAQLGSGINYWTEKSPAPYTDNAVIDNAPTASEMIAMRSAGTTQTITFSEAVVNPIMAIVSMGQPGIPVTYDFSASFNVLSEGRGYWGDGSYTVGAGDTLTGRELHGAIQFLGTFTSISWTTDRAENWHGFTFGLPAQPVAEPGMYGLMAMALAVLFGRRLARRTK